MIISLQQSQTIGLNNLAFKQGSNPISGSMGTIPPLSIELSAGSNKKSANPAVVIDLLRYETENFTLLNHKQMKHHSINNPLENAVNCNNKQDIETILRTANTATKRALLTPDAIYELVELNDKDLNLAWIPYSSNWNLINSNLPIMTKIKELINRIIKFIFHISPKQWKRPPTKAKKFSKTTVSTNNTTPTNNNKTKPSHDMNQPKTF
ncbi:hypothetical protein OAT84_01575 [Gammaproteobacteria bacterium]|nr:hypothetical protein [Gammaproteobacteria bacterium]